jgi:hypothetical protein
MAEDHLDKETSASVEMTPTGVKASAKSRLVAAIDRLCGNVFELLNAPMEAKTAETRALSEARVRAIEAMTEAGIDRLKADPDFADRAVRSHLDRILRKQLNKDGVVQQALEDLRSKPPTEQETVSGDEQIADAFMDRFERYAEDASSDELRARWGRILAAEVRKPGSVSNKALRIVDEMDSETASLFEKLCEFRLGNLIPLCLVRKPTVIEMAKLLSANLIVDPGLLGHRQTFGDAESVNGDKLWLSALGDFAIGIRKTAKLTLAKLLEETLLLTDDRGSPAFPVYLLTDAGLDISLILNDNQASALEQLVDAIGPVVNPKDAILKYKRDGESHILMQ